MKKFSKKVGLISAMALLVTVGGVYASWSYAETANVSETRNKGVSLTPAVTEGSIGSFEILYEDFEINIDQTSAGNYTPNLLFTPVAETAGDLKFKFKPEVIASDDVKANGLPAIVTFTADIKHENIDVFTFNQINIGKVNDSTTDYDWVLQDDNTFLATIPNANIGDFIKLNYTNKLDTYTKYKAFESSLAGKSIIVTINH